MASLSTEEAAKFGRWLFVQLDGCVEITLLREICAKAQSKLRAESPDIPVELAARAAELEIGANHLRGQRKCVAPIGIFVQEAINESKSTK